MGFIKAEHTPQFGSGPINVGAADAQHGQFAFMPYGTGGFDHIHPHDLGKPGTSDGRSKVARACTECKSRKMRCDGGLPFCGRCITHSRTKSCAYVDPPKRSPITRQYVSSLEAQLEEARNKIAELESQKPTEAAEATEKKQGKVPESKARPSPMPLQNRSLTGEDAFIGSMPNIPTTPAKKRHRMSISSSDSDNITSRAPKSLSFDENSRPSAPDVIGGTKAADKSEDVFGGGNFVSLTSCNAALQIASQLSQGRVSAAEGDFQAGPPTLAGGYLAEQRRASGQTSLDVSCEGLAKASATGFNANRVSCQLLPNNVDFALWDNQSRSVAYNLMDAFFEFHHPSYPILHPPTFRAQLEGTLATPSSAGWPMLVNMVFAMGAFERKTSAGEADADEHFYQQAMALYDAVQFDKAEIISVQALTLMANYCQKKNLFSNAWMILGSAVRMAIALGLHSESALQAKSMSAFDKEFGRRLWYTLFTMEADTCISMARPNCLLGINADVAQPMNVDEAAMSPTSDELPSEVSEATISSTLSAHAKFAAEVCMPLQSRLMQGTNPAIEEIRAFDLKTEEFIDSLPAYMAEDYPGSKPAWFTLASSRLRWRCNNFRMVMFRPFLLSTAVAAAAARHRGSTRPELRPAVKQAVALCRRMANDNIRSISEFWDSHPHNQAMAWHAIYFLTQSAIVPLVSLLDEPGNADARDWISQLQTCVRLLTDMGLITPIGAKCKEAIESLAGALLQEPANATSVAESLLLSEWMSEAQAHVASSHETAPSELDPLVWSAHMLGTSSHGSDDGVFSGVPGHPTDPSLTMSLDSASSDGMSTAFDFARGVDGSPDEHRSSLAGSMDQWVAVRPDPSSRWPETAAVKIPERTDPWFALQAAQPGSSHHDDASSSLFGTSEQSVAAAPSQHGQHAHHHVSSQSQSQSQPQQQSQPHFEWHHATDPSSWWNMQYKQETSPATSYGFPPQQQPHSLPQQHHHQHQQPSQHMHRPPHHQVSRVPQSSCHRSERTPNRSSQPTFDRSLNHQPRHLSIRPASRLLSRLVSLYHLFVTLAIPVQSLLSDLSEFQMLLSSSCLPYPEAGFGVEHGQEYKYKRS
ncbi:hypothetical protein BCV70DRAFT_206681 [Testicularia cyperi]|uniref:Zn(2)-C6 fungal-type domain-containing protein n=1 Tax=Testicularia cyperi TaxID=1882483 RepID=A0A317XP80_9BASI|nr:hypothetical protein BCV70DRAFT_206681 [Testicularia cyperi]